MPKVTPQELGYLAGMFDGEGTVYWKESTKQRSLLITNSELNLLDECLRICTLLDIKGKIRPQRKTPLKPHHKPVYEIGVFDQLSFRNFLQVPFRSILKREKLEAMLASYVIAPYRRP